MKVTIVIDHEDLRKLVLKHLQEMVEVPLEKGNVRIEVKSKQNYKAEWEEAELRAVYEGRH